VGKTSAFAKREDTGEKKGRTIALWKGGVKRKKKGIFPHTSEKKGGWTRHCKRMREGGEPPHSSRLTLREGEEFTLDNLIKKRRNDHGNRKERGINNPPY